MSDPINVEDHLLFMAKQGGEDEANEVHEAARQVSRGLDDADLSRELLSDYFKQAQSRSRWSKVSRAEQWSHAQKLAQQGAAVTAEYVSNIFPVDPVPACGEGEDEARVAAELAAELAAFNRKGRRSRACSKCCLGCRNGFGFGSRPDLCTGYQQRAQHQQQACHRLLRPRCPYQPTLTFMLRTHCRCKWRPRAPPCQ